jgi:hypothetical protein
MANKRTPSKSGKAAAQAAKSTAKTTKPAIRPRAPTASLEASTSVLSGPLKPLIRDAFAKRLRG